MDLTRKDFLKTVAGGLVAACAAELEEETLIRDGKYDGAIIFTNTDGIEFPQNFIDMLCNQNIGAGINTSSYFSVPIWFKREADRYNTPFEMNLSVHPRQIQIPKDFMFSAGSDYPFSISSLLRHLRSIEPNLINYDFLSINHSMSSDEINSYTYPSYSLDRGAGFFLGIQKVSPGVYIPPYPSIFAHEFAHLLGARDKYRSPFESPTTCSADVPNDLMCGSGLIEHDGNILRFSFSEQVISEPTAREMGWVR